MVRPPAAKPRIVAPAYRRAPDEKRDSILAAAAGLFAERGYAGATTAAIASRARVSEGIVFHHFGSKRKLFVAVVAHHSQGLVIAMLGEDPGTNTAAPEQAIRNAFRYVRENRTVHRLFAIRDPELAELVHDTTRSQVVVALEKTFQAGVERGELRAMRPRIVAELCYALVDGALQACFVDRDDVDEAEEEAYLSEAIRCVIGALVPLVQDTQAEVAAPSDRKRSSS
jgi:AcrR family transcriptional regulator